MVASSKFNVNWSRVGSVMSGVTLVACSALLVLLPLMGLPAMSARAWGEKERKVSLTAVARSTRSLRALRSSNPMVTFSTMLSGPFVILTAVRASTPAPLRTSAFWKAS